MQKRALALAMLAGAGGYGQLAQAQLAPGLLDAAGANMTLNRSNTTSTVTVIDRRMIEMSGAQSIAEAVTLAPGVISGNRTSSQTTVAYPGMSDEYSRSLQVLVNGQSVYTPTTGGVNWRQIPVPIQTVERIEVLHGPGSAIQGANAMNATINIITRSARTSPRAGGSLYIDNQGRKTAYAETSIIDGDFGMTGSVSRREGVGLTQKDTEFEDEIDTTSVMLHAEYALMDGRGEIAADVAGTRGSEMRGGITSPFTDAQPDPQELHKRTSNNNFQRLSLTLPTPDGGTVRLQGLRLQDKLEFGYNQNVMGIPVPINGDYDGTREEAELSYSKPINDSLEVTVGGNIRQDELESEFYLGDEASYKNTIKRAFVASTWQATDKLTLVADVTTEESDLMDRETAPTLSATYQITPKDSVRVGYAEGYRAPMAYEERADRYASIPPFGDIYLVKGLYDLNAETNTTWDVAWNHREGKALETNVRVYQSKLENLVATQFVPWPGLTVNPQGLMTFNNSEGEIQLRGAEASVKWQPGPWLVWGSAALTDMDTDRAAPGTAALYDDTVPETTATLLVGRDFGNDVSASVRYTYVSEFQWAYGDYPRLDAQHVVDAQVRKTWKVGQTDLSLALVGKNLNGTNEDFRTDAGHARSVGIELAMNY